MLYALVVFFLSVVSDSHTRLAIYTREVSGCVELPNMLP